MPGPDRITDTTDIPMLEELRERGNLNPIHIAEGINRDRNYVSSRLSFLADLGLVENLGHGLYTITEQGEAFLDGDLDAGELPDPAAD